MRIALTLAAAVAFALTGCEHAGDHDDGTTSHVIKATHGGTVVHLAEHGPTIEVVWDGKAGTITLHSTDEHGKTKNLDKAPLAKVQKGTVVVTGVGANAKWTFTHENLKGSLEDHPHVAFKVTMAGKTYDNDNWHPAEK